MLEIARGCASCMINILRKTYYFVRMIRSFSDKRAVALFDGESYMRWKAYDSIATAALRKLDMLNAHDFSVTENAAGEDIARDVNPRAVA